jgi:hypothetical protein
MTTSAVRQDRAQRRRRPDGGIESLLTMMDGRIVYGAGPYAELEEPRPRH